LLYSSVFNRSNLLYRTVYSLAAVRLQTALLAP